MVSPVYARPNYNKDVTTSGIHTFTETKTQRSVQKAPFNLNTGFVHTVGNFAQSQYSGLYYGSAYPVNGSQDMPLFRYDSSLATETLNKSYEKLKGKIYTSTQLGVDFVEYRQALTSITKASTTLWKAIVHVKRFRFLEAARELRLAYVPKGVSVRKSFANNWLEYHFGWEPLYQDVHDALEIMNNPINAFTKARGASKIKFTNTETQNYGSVLRTTVYTVQYASAQGAAVKAINNVGLHSLDQFGLLNPLSIAWELVPFSFVVDWFANVGQVLSSFSDFAGMTLQGQYYVFHYSATASTVWTPTGVPAPGFSNLKCIGTGTYYQRGAALANPSFNVKKLRLPSKVRAATAVSLVIQQLKSK